MSTNPERCACEEAESVQDSDSGNSASSSPKNVRSPISLTSLQSIFKRRRSLKKKPKKSPAGNYVDAAAGPNGNATSSSSSTGSRKSPRWPLKLYPGRKKSKSAAIQYDGGCSRCACYRRADDASGDARTEAADAAEAAKSDSNVPEHNEEEPAEVRVEFQMNDSSANRRILRSVSLANIEWNAITLEDEEEEARIERAREIERGVDPPSNFRPARRVQLLCTEENNQAPRRLQILCPADVTIDSLRIFFQNVTFRSSPLDVGCHTQVDFIHCLVPDLLNITNCSFYWGKMDRYAAERLLEGKREGTFLLRDSAQEEFLFSVSFRKYGRSLHARIEQWNHKFSFDSHDPGVYTSNTVCGLIEHYKDPSSCMFFEPMLTWPLHRNFVFSLQHLCRASIVSKLSYDDVNQLQLPKTLKSYLKEYHYRQKVRVARFDDDVSWLDLRGTPA